jgi:2-polyprenyl-3-methyl-5-hydroxy-6-metoxy-1,4-benzoquinol methylase
LDFFLKIRAMNTSAKDVFQRIYDENGWEHPESVSGRGSMLRETRHLIRELPYLFREFQVGSILDAPCGDRNWIQHVDMTGVGYVGVDIVPDLIAANRRKFPDVEMHVADIMTDDLPRADLILCRDVLFHFPNADILRTLANLKRTGSRYLLTTSFNWRAYRNYNIPLGRFRRINLETPPFNLPRPLRFIVEGNTEREEQSGAQFDRCLCLWAFEDILTG